MSYDAHGNLSYGTVLTAPVPAASGTSVVLNSGEGADFPAAPFNCTVWPVASATNPRPRKSNAEIVRVTAVVGDTLTIVRAQEGTSARAIEVGDQIANTITAKVLTDVETQTVSSTLTSAHLLVGNGSNVATDVAASGDLTLANTGAFTLATVNGNVGSFGSATQSGTFTVNAKGLVTAAANATVTPAVGSITGLGTGVATALAVNVGSTGAPVVFDGALGTPSSGSAANLTSFPTLNQNTTGSAASLSVSGQTGLMTVTGLTSTNRVKTVRDAADTILELGGSYTPTGTWTSMTLVTPALGTPASGVVTNLTGTASININGTVGATTPTTGSFTSIVASSTITPSQTAGIVGTTTNNNANAGSVGEYVESVIASGSAVSLTTATAANVTSISLTAGDWDVQGIAYFLEGATTTATLYDAAISTTTASIPSTDLGMTTRTPGTGAVKIGSTIHSTTLPTFRLLLSSTTTVYLCVRGTFSVSTMTAYGAIRARRRR